MAVTCWAFNSITTGVVVELTVAVAVTGVRVGARVSVGLETVGVDKGRPCAEGVAATGTGVSDGLVGRMVAVAVGGRGVTVAEAVAGNAVGDFTPATTTGVTGAAVMVGDALPARHIGRTGEPGQNRARPPQVKSHTSKPTEKAQSRPRRWCLPGSNCNAPKKEARPHKAETTRKGPSNNISKGSNKNSKTRPNKSFKERIRRLFSTPQNLFAYRQVSLSELEGQIGGDIPQNGVTHFKIAPAQFVKRGAGQNH